MTVFPESRSPEELSDLSLAERVGHYRLHFPDFARDCLMIRDKDGNLVPFILNPPQLALWEVIKRKIENGEPVRIYILKARQLGFSTMIEGLAYWYAALRKFKNALLVSYSNPSANEIFQMTKRFWKFTPEELRPAEKKNNRREMHFATKTGGNDSRIITDTADNVNLGAGHTIQFAHLSESARYPQIQAQYDAMMTSLDQSIPERPWTFIFKETTAQGPGAAKDEWDDPDSGFENIFVSWIADREYRLTDDSVLWREKYRVTLENLSRRNDADYGNEEKLFQHIADEVRIWHPELSTDDEIIEEVKARLAWRRFMIDRKTRGKKELFSQEYPSYAEEAWQISSSSLFSQKKLNDIKEYITSEAPEYTRYAYSRLGDKIYQSAHGGIKVYEEPLPNKTYGIGADVCWGLEDEERDKSAAVVLDTDGRMVAVYHGQPEPDDFAYILNALGRWYGNALLICEADGPGLTTNLKLSKELYYPYLFMREVVDTSKHVKKVRKKPGWKRTGPNKSVSVNALREAVHKDHILINDMDVVHELSTYEKNGNKLEAAGGKFDDLVDATCYAWQAILRVTPKKERQVADNEFGYSFESLGGRVDAMLRHIRKKW